MRTSSGLKTARGFRHRWPGLFAWILLGAVLVVQTEGRAGEGGNKPEPQGIALLSGSDSPDPFSPNADGVKDTHVLTLNFQISRMEVIQDNEENQKGFVVETTEEIRDSGGTKSWSICKGMWPLQLER